MGKKSEPSRANRTIQGDRKGPGEETSKNKSGASASENKEDKLQKERADWEGMTP